MFALPAKPLVMGVLNLDLAASLGQKGAFVDKVLAQAEQMLEQGATIVDICSSESISLQEELNLLIPSIEAIKKRMSVNISVNTSIPEVMDAAVRVGAAMINDPRALTKLGAIEMVAKLQIPVCLMHMHSDPVTKQVTWQLRDIVSDVYQYLEQRITASVAAGVEIKNIMIDPGFGFGKTLAQNLQLLRSLHVFKSLNCPLLIDVSHKSMIGQILDETVENRVYGSIAAESFAIICGVNIIRSHDVQATNDAIKVMQAISEQ